MPDPKEVFDNPGSHWLFLTTDTDDQFEAQHFDRKEIPGYDRGAISSSQLSSVREHIRECVSAFANINRDGGLVVLGISKTGEVTGIDHLTEEQKNSLTSLNNMVASHASIAKEYEYMGKTEAARTICLVYVPYAPSAMCHLVGAEEKAYERRGPQNIMVTADRRQQLIYEKGIQSFERTTCCPYDPQDLETGVVAEFRRVYLQDAPRDFTDEELLRQAGAIVMRQGEYHFTNAGFLFFAANPQRVFPSAHVRVVRYEADLAAGRSVGAENLDKQFSGSITKLIRDMRTYFRESGFFKSYQRREPEGGFRGEPEYPPIAVDEVLVNAIVHRDYAHNNPIVCEKYADALVVRNPGRLMQPERDVPPEFFLDASGLDSLPRNPLLMEWLKLIRDERGDVFVRQLSEGTKRMQEEMARMRLPPPRYDVSNANTTVTLFSNAPEREALLRSEVTSEATEYANLFPLTITSETGALPSTLETDFERRAVMDCIENSLRNQKWFIHRNAFGRLVAHMPNSEVITPPEIRKVLRLFPAYIFQVRSYQGRLYLLVDYTLEWHNVCTARELLAIPGLGTLVDRKTLVKWDDKTEDARITSLDSEWAKVALFRAESEVQIPTSQVWPSIPKDWIQRLLCHKSLHFDLDAAIKANSLASQPNAARIRDERVCAVSELLARDVFPLVALGMRIGLQPKPLALSRYGNGSGALTVHSLAEPVVEFKQHRESPNIREGITSFGSYDDEPKTIELVPVCATPVKGAMAALIERLKVGKYRYRGAERTFACRLTYQSIVTADSDKAVASECERLLSEHPEWSSANRLDRLFLVCTPEEGYSGDDENSPYYQAKRVLLENGLPCQMVDSPTLANPDYKDLNLALNVVAKCGITPWVFPDAIPDADFFVGLSYTEDRQRNSERLMGYANVFNAFGRWVFYSGNIEPFMYQQRGERFGELVKSTLAQLDLHETPSIYFHYSAKFSRDDREAIVAACREVRPFGKYSFVWINQHHNLRLYDRRPETDGSISRGSYVQTSPNQLYISTTGFNPYRKAMGTPKPLEVNVWVEEAADNRRSLPDLKALATQVLALTKLNWASTDSLCAEPITIKYAHDIAYLTSAFVRQRPGFRLHRRLERTPWFI